MDPMLLCADLLSHCSPHIPGTPTAMLRNLGVGMHTLRAVDAFLHPNDFLMFAILSGVRFLFILTFFSFTFFPPLHLRTPNAIISHLFAEHNS